MSGQNTIGKTGGTDDALDVNAHTDILFGTGSRLGCQNDDNLVLYDSKGAIMNLSRTGFGYLGNTVATQAWSNTTFVKNNAGNNGGITALDVWTDGIHTAYESNGNWTPLPTLKGGNILSGDQTLQSGNLSVSNGNLIVNGATYLNSGPNFLGKNSGTSTSHDTKANTTIAYGTVSRVQYQQDDNIAGYDDSGVVFALNRKNFSWNGNTVATVNQLILPRSNGYTSYYNSTSRVANTNYYNTTGRPIVVLVTFEFSAQSWISFRINSYDMMTFDNSNASSNALYKNCFSIIVPVGASYNVGTSGTTVSIVNWQEG